MPQKDPIISDRIHPLKKPSSKGSGLPFANSVKSEDEEAKSPVMRKVLSIKEISPKKEKTIENAPIEINENLLGGKNQQQQIDIEGKKIREKLHSPIKELVRAKLAS